MDIEMGWVVDVTNVLDPFDSKVFIFQKTMQVQIVKVIELWLCFLIAYDSHQVHNMLAFMFDPRFKSLWVLENYVGRGDVIHLVIEYDAKVVILLMMTIFDVLNSINQAFATQVGGSYVGIVIVEKEDNNIFCVGAFIEESSCALIVGELFLFKRLFIVPTACADSLAWWHLHETSFPNVGFLAK